MPRASRAPRRSARGASEQQDPGLSALTAEKRSGCGLELGLFPAPAVTAAAGRTLSGQTAGAEVRVLLAHAGNRFKRQRGVAGALLRPAEGV